MSETKENIKKFFLINPTQKIRVRQLERLLKLSLPSIIRYLKELEKEEIVQKETIAEVTLFSANRSSDQFLLQKKNHNQQQIYASGIVRHLKIISVNPVVVLFGSYARGEDIETSDIDLYIESPSKILQDFRKFEYVLQRNIHVFCHKELKEIKSTELKNNIINGIVLCGQLDVFK